MRRLGPLTLSALIALLGCGKKSDEAESTGEPTSAPLAPPDDEARMQGVWVAERVDFIPEVKVAPPPDELKNLSATVKGSLVIATREGAEGKEYFVFTLDPKKTPAWIDLSEANEKGKIRRRKVFVPEKSTKEQDVYEERTETLPGVYKFEGEILVLAFNPPKSARPTVFKVGDPRKGTPDKEVAAVGVLRLKKK